jgi:hypothetical protein
MLITAINLATTESITNVLFTKIKSGSAEFLNGTLPAHLIIDNNI